MVFLIDAAKMSGSRKIYSIQEVQTIGTASMCDTKFLTRALSIRIPFPITLYMLKEIGISLNSHCPICHVMFHQRRETV